MRIFKNAWFERFARKHHISDEMLIETVKQAERGLIDADLGSGVIKQRIARPGLGKSGGYRTIVFYRTEQRAVFMFGFAKSEQANISAQEATQFKKAAPLVLGLSDSELTLLIANGQFSEVTGYDK